MKNNATLRARVLALAEENGIDVDLPLTESSPTTGAFLAVSPDGHLMLCRPQAVPDHLVEQILDAQTPATKVPALVALAPPAESAFLVEQAREMLGVRLCPCCEQANGHPRGNGYEDVCDACFDKVLDDEARLEAPTPEAGDGER